MPGYGVHRTAVSAITSPSVWLSRHVRGDFTSLQWCCRTSWLWPPYEQMAQSAARADLPQSSQLCRRRSVSSVRKNRRPFLQILSDRAAAESENRAPITALFVDLSRRTLRRLTAKAYTMETASSYLKRRAIRVSTYAIKVSTSWRATRGERSLGQVSHGTDDCNFSHYPTADGISKRHSDFVLCADQRVK